MTDLLVDDHAEVDALLRGLMSEFDSLDARAALARLDYVWARLAVHIRAEHLHLFPALLTAADEGRAGRLPEAPTPEEVRACVERLREDHDFFMRELAGAVNAARELVAQDSPPDRERLRRIMDRVLAVTERLGAHNRVEEEQVYLWPAALLSEAERDTLRDGMKREIENLPSRFSEGSPH